MGGRLEVRITPADVGKRVSVRRMTGQRESDARFTDTVGVLTSWADGVLRIIRRNGEQVTLAEETLVAGKVVPAAPGRRRGVPAAAVRELQLVASRGWPAPETEQLGEWTLRAAGGFTRRANSVLAEGAPGVDVDTALGHVLRWYAERELTPYVQVATGDPGDARRLDAELAARGWTAEAETLMRVGPLAPLADRAPDPRVRLHRTADDTWLDAYGRVAGGTGEAAVQVLAGGPSVWFATMDGDDGGHRTGQAAAGGGAPTRPAAIGRCVVDGRWAGFAAVEVDPRHRRRGCATAVMAELARRALQEGASAAYLQVERDNPAAAALYDRLGFAEHHAYHYRRAPKEDR